MVGEHPEQEDFKNFFSNTKRVGQNFCFCF